jgi:hypothetical protein
VDLLRSGTAELPFSSTFGTAANPMGQIADQPRGLRDDLATHFERIAKYS